MKHLLFAAVIFMSYASFGSNQQLDENNFNQDISNRRQVAHEEVEKLYQSFNRLKHQHLMTQTNFLFNYASKLINAKNTTATDNFPRRQQYLKQVQNKRAQIQNAFQRGEFEVVQREISEAQAALEIYFPQILAELKPSPEPGDITVTPLVQPNLVPVAPPLPSSFSSFQGTSHAKAVRAPLQEQEALKACKDKGVGEVKETPSLTELLAKALDIRRNFIIESAEGEKSEWEDD